MNVFEVLIDLGHGGFDSGAMGNGLIEKEVVLEVGKQVKNNIERSFKKTDLTRYDDVHVTLNRRVEIANLNKYDIFVSIHANAFTNTSVNGIETFISSWGGEREKLAKIVNSKLVNASGLTDRGVKAFPYQVLRQTSMPAILVEIGFLTNKKDAEYIKENKETIARAISDGILEYSMKEGVTMKDPLRPEGIQEQIDILWDNAFGTRTEKEEEIGEEDVFKTINYLEKSDRVKEMQLMLNTTGANLVIDGSFGPATRSAVQVFQRLHGLTSFMVTTNVGRETWDALVLASKSPITEEEEEKFIPIYYLEKSDRVKELQSMLNLTGARLSVDGSFGPATRSALQSFQRNNNLIITQNVNETTWNTLVSTSSKPKEGYFMIREFNTNIHIYALRHNEHLSVSLGINRRLEKPSSIAVNEKAIAFANCGFFNFDGSSEHLGMLVNEGLYYNPPSGSFIDLVYYKDGSVTLENLSGYNAEYLVNLQRNAYWGIGTSYSLVQNGKVNLENSNLFSHSRNREPRTMIGFDGKRFIIAVADGRSSVSLGLTGQQQAEVMLGLGCVIATNLDGGGSSVLGEVINGKAVLRSKPSGGSERNVGSVLLVKPK